MAQTVYKIKELIIQKFGEENFDVACNVVANLLRTLNENFWITEDVKEMCNITDLSIRLSFTEGLLLSKFFKIEYPEDLFREPLDAIFCSHFERRQGYAAVDTSPPVNTGNI